MKNYKESWLFTGTSQEALLNELVKIGQEDSKKKGKHPIKSLLKAVAAGAVGSATGTALAFLAAKHAPKLLKRTVVPRGPYAGHPARVLTGEQKEFLKRYVIPGLGGLGGLLGGLYATKAQKHADEEYGRR